MPLPPLPQAPAVLPPFVGATPAERALRAPYRATVTEFTAHFGTSVRRAEILRGLIAFRAALRNEPLNSHFQWLAGSFVEALNREPNDVDVVTFYSLTASQVATIQSDPAAQARIRALFDTAAVRSTYQCDAYPVNIAAAQTDIIEDAHYWYGLFSHQKATSVWKGIVAVEMSDPADDASGEALLVSRGF